MAEQNDPTQSQDQKQPPAPSPADGPKNASKPSKRQREMKDPRGALVALRSRIQTDGVFGAAEGVELLTLIIADGEDRQADEDKIEEPPNTANQ